MKSGARGTCMEDSSCHRPRVRGIISAVGGPRNFSRIQIEYCMKPNRAEWSEVCPHGYHPAGVRDFAKALLRHPVRYNPSLQQQHSVVHTPSDDF